MRCASYPRQGRAAALRPSFVHGSCSMHMRSRFRPPHCLLAALLPTLGLVAYVAAPADLPAQGRLNDHYGLIVLNDGYVLQGKVQREGAVTDVDAVTQTPFTVPKGFFLVDDGPRRIVFSQKQVRVITKMDPPTDDILHFAAPPPILGKPMPPVAEVV